MFNDSEFRKSLLVSLVTSVLVLIFIEPLLKWAANAIMWVGDNISAGFTRSAYTSAALGFHEKYSFIELMFLLSVLIGMVSGFASVRLVPSPRKEGKLQASIWRKSSISVLVALVLLISSVYVTAANFIEFQLNASFNQRITVLAAKANEQQIKDLKAAWALMENRSDYEAITVQMNSFAKAQGVKLPAALWE